MEAKDMNSEIKNLNSYEEAELTVITFDETDVIITSGEGESTTKVETTTSASCLAPGTKITMADGTVKNIENIREGDLVLTFSHETGCYKGSEVIFAYKGDAPKCLFTVHFSNDAELSIVSEHDLFEQESRKYVTLTNENAEQFIGKHFYSVAEKTYVELVNVTYNTEAVEYYEIFTKNTLNCVANGMLNVSNYADFLLNIYEFDESLKADEKVLTDDIQKYGIFEYSEKRRYSKEEYDVWNMRYRNIAVGKGLITLDEALEKYNEAECF